MFSSDVEAAIGLKSTTVALVRHVEPKADRSFAAQNYRVTAMAKAGGHMEPQNDRSLVSLALTAL